MTIRYRFKLPEKVRGFDIGGLSFDHFYVRSSEYTWSELAMPPIEDIFAPMHNTVLREDWVDESLCKPR